MSALRRDAVVALSVDALAGAWARQEGAPSGAVQTAEQEIAARLRGGVEWRVSPATAVAMVVRPSLPAERGDLVWIAGTLAAARAVAELRGEAATPWWPDRVAVDGRVLDDVAVGAHVHLGPGIVDHALLVVRVGRASAEEAVIDAMTAVLPLLDEPEALLAELRAVEGWRRQALVRLASRSESRGEIAGVDDTGGLELRSPSGMVERFAVVEVLTVEPIG
jgi:biotin-(acetyl-CoA carboxylase) ligase